MGKTTYKKQDFISFLASVSDTELNDYIKSHGKPPKKVRLYHLVNNKEKTYDEARNISNTKPM